MNRTMSKSQIKVVLIVFLIGLFVRDSITEDITKAVLDVEFLQGYPVAYGDFNSDEMTDVFFLVEESDGHYLKIFFGSEEPPLLRNFNVSCKLSGPNNREYINNEQKLIYFMVGDFDGDGALDVLTTHQNKHTYTSFIYYGDTNKLHCDKVHKFDSNHHPIAIDYNDDLIIDFLITNRNTKKTQIVTNIKREQKFLNVSLFDNEPDRIIAEPVRSSYVDIDGNKYADLVIATNVGIDFCTNSATEKLNCKTLANYTNNVAPKNCGEMVFVDLGLTGKLNVLLPCCTSDKKCDIYLLNDDKQFINLNLTFDFMHEWTFLTEDNVPGIFNKTSYLRQIDFNMDGYPDFLVNLVHKNVYRTVLIENVPYDGKSLIKNRRLIINWNGFSFLENAISASVFDSSQNGNLDIFAVFKAESNYKTKVFKHVMNENINFLKILVLSGKQNTSLSNTINLNKKMKYYGTPNIGTSISYHRLTQEGIEEKSTAVQNQKSTYMALELQYVIFGLGKTPEFVDNLTVSLNGQSKSWFLNIPNSQVVVLPIDPKDPKYWIIKLFVTPSKLILYSLISLIGVCLVLSVLIGVLHWRERQEDKKERLEGPHFHFDAM